MDHLPYPKNAAVPRNEIPYICGKYEEYDLRGFLDYPVRRGWAGSPQSFQWMDCPSECVAERAQNWLFFGLLHEFFGEGYRKESFLRRRHNTERHVIDTTSLPESLTTWVQSTQQHQRNGTVSGRFGSEQYFDHLDEIFIEVESQSERVERICPESRWITLSVKVLLQSMQHAVSNVDYRLVSRMYCGRVPPAIVSFLSINLKTWCVGQAIGLCAQYSVIMYNYLAALPRLTVNLDHEQCSKDKCTANNVDFATYNTRHSQDDCQCQFSGPDIGKITRLISEGSIPLVTLAFHADGSPYFDIIKAEPGVEYTAISHVWVGGLGNFRANELPRCQLERLSKLITQVSVPRRRKLFLGLRSFIKSVPPLSQLLFMKQVYRPPFKMPERNSSYFREGIYDRLKLYRNQRPQRVTFWMDTLLIPVGEANASLRNKAIQSMALVYARAKNVLVLDAELQNISLQDIPLEQASAHVLCSSWMTRCWTLQEACLSGNWVVQFKDGIFDPHVAKERAYAVRQKAIKDAAWNDQVELIQESISWYDEMPGLRRLSVLDKSQNSELMNFINTWNHLNRRSTSKAEDLHAIFANMLDLPAGEILRLSHDQRTKAILSTQSTLPLALLYNSGLKLNDARNHWVPRNIQGSLFEESRGELTATADGLLLTGGYHDKTYTGFLVHHLVPRFEKFRIVDPVKSETIWVYRALDDTNPRIQIPESIETFYLMNDLDTLTQAEKHKVRHLAARFAVVGRDGRLLRLRYESYLRSSFSRPEEFTMSIDYGHEDEEFPMIAGTRTAKDQSFLLECG